MKRREFLAAAITSAATPLVVAAQSPWGGPVLDIHVHPRQVAGQELDHLEGSGCAKGVILAHAGRDDRAKAAVEKHPDRFVWFANPDVSKPDIADLLRAAFKDGAIGAGELQNHVDLDGPEMRRVYEVAAEFHLPVLLHFQDGVMNSGFARLPAILKEYSKTTFIGHANSWWANISADVDPKVGYPKGLVKPGGLTDRMLAEYPNLYGDLSANSGRNALGRDPDFAAAFLARHQSKLMFGSDCGCRDGNGTGQTSQEPLIKGKCVARETLTALKQLTSPEVFRRITWDNGVKLLKLSA